MARDENGNWVPDDDDLAAYDYGSPMRDNVIRIWETDYNRKNPATNSAYRWDYTREDWVLKNEAQQAEIDRQGREWQAEQQEKAAETMRTYRPFQDAKKPKKGFEWKDEPRKGTHVLGPGHEKMCKGCKKPLDVGQPRNAQYHPACATKYKKRRQRARQKARIKEMKQMLGLLPIEEKVDKE